MAAQSTPESKKMRDTPDTNTVSTCISNEESTTHSTNPNFNMAEDCHSTIQSADIADDVDDEPREKWMKIGPATDEMKVEGDVIAREPTIFTGIDMGSSHCVAASTNRSAPHVFTLDLNPVANRSTPNVITLDNRLRLVGEEAESRASSMPAQTVWNVGSLLGLEKEESWQSLQRRNRYTSRHTLLSDTGSEEKHFVVPLKVEQERRLFRPEVLFSTIMERLAADSRSTYGFRRPSEISSSDTCTEEDGVNQQRVVVAVPCTYTKKQKIAVAMACKLAGLQRFDVISDADALLYTMGAKSFAELDDTLEMARDNGTRNEEGTKGGSKEVMVGVLDVGLSTTTIQVLLASEVKTANGNGIVGDVIQGKSVKEGNSRDIVDEAVEITLVKRRSAADLGVLEFVSALADWVIEKVKEKYHYPIDPQSRLGNRIFNASVKLMKDLSGLVSSSIDIEGAIENESDIHIPCSRSEFEEICFPYVGVMIHSCTSVMQFITQKKMKDLIKDTLKAARDAHQDTRLVGIELMGGGCRIPWVQDCLLQYSSSFGPYTIRKTLDGSAAVAMGAARCCVLRGALDDVEAAVMIEKNLTSSSKSLSSSRDETSLIAHVLHDHSRDAYLRRIVLSSYSPSTANHPSSSEDKGSVGGSKPSQEEVGRVIDDAAEKYRAFNEPLVREAVRRHLPRQQWALMKYVLATSSLPIIPVDSISDEENVSNYSGDDSTAGEGKQEMEAIKELDEFNEKMKLIERVELERRKRHNALESAVLALQSALHGKHQKLLEGTKVEQLVKEADEFLLDVDLEKASASDYINYHEKFDAQIREAAPAYFEALQEEKRQLEDEIMRATEQKKLEAKKDDIERNYTPSQGLSRAQKNKEEGTELFKDGNFQLAEMRYCKALQYLKSVDDKNCTEAQTGHKRSLELACNLNIAQCLLKIGGTDNAEKVVIHCTDALNIEPQNLKALFRRGTAYEKLRQLKKSLADFQEGEGFAPEDDTWRKAGERVSRQIKLQKEKEKKMYMRMMG